VNIDPKIRPIEEARSRPAVETARPAMPFWRQLLIAVLALAALAAGYTVYDRFGSGGEGSGPIDATAPTVIPVVLAVAEQRQTATRVEAVGTTLSRRAIQIVPMASGRVEQIAFEPGQFVKAGDVLVRLDDDIQRADVAEAEAKLQETVLALQRANALRQKNAVPEATVDQLVAAQASGQAELDRARRRLADRTVRAPFAGVMGLRQVDLGARVDENSVLTTLDDRSEMEIEFSLAEAMYGQIFAGQPVVATSVAFPGRSFEGVVINIDSRVDPTSRAFKVRARLPNPDLTLPAGMFMQIAVVLDSREAIMIPEEAVIVQGNRTFVYVVAGGKAAVRPIRVGHRETGAVEVAEGVAAGEAVVVRGSPRLRDGAPVQVIEEGGAAPAGPA
jgi:membrane fusion protein (multidrug efflux system)